MFVNIFTRSLISLLLTVASEFTHAEDIDIFSQNTVVTAGAPNVLIVMDNSANWSSALGGQKKFNAEMLALKQVVSALKTQFNLGIAFYSESGSGNSNTQGGYIRFAIQGMTNIDEAGVSSATEARNCLLMMLGGTEECPDVKPGYTVLDEGYDKGSFNNLSLGMAEAYRYYAGLNAYAGNDKVKADPLAFISGTISGPLYNSPISAVGCQKNFIIHINNGPNEPSSSVTEANGLLTSAGGDATMIVPPDSNSKNSAADEWTRFLNKVSTVNAVTYTLEVGPETNTTGVYNTALLQSMGRQGKGGYYAAVDSETLLEALTKIFNDINAQNSVFASSSLPLSADNSGAFLNQVYIGVFRPDAQGRPRWYGNLKQYKFALDSNESLFLADRTGTAVASPSTGFAKPDALSYWTGLDDDFTYTTTPPSMPYTSTPDSAITYTANPGTGGFWAFDNKGAGGAYDAADGEWVEKGGAAQRLRLEYLGYGNNKAGTARGSVGTSSSTGRKVYTCTGTCLTTTGTAFVGTPASNTTFDSSNTLITKELLGAADAVVTSISSATPNSISTLVAGGVPNAIASISKSRGLGTVTTSLAHGFTTGDTVLITGASGQLDGTYVITVSSSTKFTFVASNGTASSTTGNAIKASTTATAFVTGHGFTVGQRITIAGATPIAFNGVVFIDSVSLDGNSFTYTLSAALAQAATGTITATSNTATATAFGHGLASGNTVTIAGATPTGYNGVYVVTKIDADSFSYSYPTAAPLATATGTINASVGGGRTTLINWIRGVDTQDENGNANITDVRASIHGDVLHSRPIVLNYSASTSSNNVYLFYGGNDGVFRAIKGGQGATDGIEQWAFIPEEFFGKFKRLYDNSPQVDYPSTPSGLTPPPQKRDYFWDGPVGSYVERNTSGTVTKAYLYIAARRGGRFIYALDVTSPTAPKFLWKKGCSSLTDNTTCDSGFAELGQTWSQPQIIKVKANTNPVLIFGGGYDPVSEDPEVPATDDDMGRGVFVLDAFSGTLLWSAVNSTYTASTTAFPVTGMNFSIAADVLPIDRTFDGYADRVYAADVGGNVWRLDIGDPVKANWKVWKIASVGVRPATATTRKFLFGMDVVLGASFDAVVIGSGDREHPLATNDANDVINRVYMFKDTTGATGTSLGISDTCGASVTTSCSNLFDATNSSAVPDDALGWSITLASGEKVVNAPVVAGGNMLFGTNQPDTSNLTCSPNLGIAKRYSINYLNAAGTQFRNSNGDLLRSEIAVGGGFLPSTVTGVVDVDGKKIIFATDNPLNPGGAIKVTITVPTKRYRTYWHQKIE